MIKVYRRELPREYQNSTVLVAPIQVSAEYEHDIPWVQPGRLSLLERIRKSNTPEKAAERICKELDPKSRLPQLEELLTKKLKTFHFGRILVLDDPRIEYAECPVIKNNGDIKLHFKYEISIFGFIYRKKREEETASLQ